MNITFLLILATWVAVSIFIRNTFKINTKGAKGFYWLIVSIICFDLFIILISASRSINFPHLLWLAVPLKFLIGPGIYFINWRGKKGKKRNLQVLHFVPAALVFVALLPIYTLDAQPKIQFFLESNWQAAFLKYALVAQLVIYIVFQVQMYYKHHKKSNQGSVNNHIIFISGLTLYALFTFLNDSNAQLGVMAMIGNFMLAIAALSHKPFHARGVKRPMSNVNLAGQIERVMQEERLYLQPDLSLSRLADLMNSSTNKISNALNNELSCNYNDYVNRYRVREAIRLLKDESYNKYTFEAISQMVGFGSLTTFNGAFKKQTGKTPRQFKV